MIGSRGWGHVQKVEEVAPGWWSHRLTITDPTQLDAEVQSWLRESYRLMGLQARLTDRVRIRPRKPGADMEGTR